MGVKMDFAQLSYSNFNTFCDWVFNEKYENAWFHKKWCIAVQDGTVKRALNLAPRNSGKTTVWAKKAPLWLLGRNPNLKILMLSRTANRAANNMRFIKSNIETNKRLKQVFPALKQSIPWSDDELTVENTRMDGEASVVARGLGGSIPGLRADILICFDDKTEVLTLSGFKFFRDITPEDLIATLSKDEYLEYQLPSRIIINPYNDELVTFNSPHLDFAVTPEHNLYIARKGNNWEWKNFELFPASRAYGMKTLKFKKDAKWHGEKLDSITIPRYEVKWHAANNCSRSIVFDEKYLNADDLLEFLGFWVAEGTLGFRHKGFPDLVRVFQNDNEHLKFILGKLDRLGIDYKIRKIGCDSKVKDVAIHDSQLAHYIYENFGHLSENKHIPEWLKALCPEQLRLFYDGYMRGDGNKSGTTAATTSRRLADDLVEIALKIGYSGNVGKITGGHIKHYKCRDYYYVTFNKHKNQPHIRHRASNGGWKKLPYNGLVYCVTVPNGIIYVRRNGKSMWAGNCDDLVDKTNVMTETQRQKVHEFWDEQVIPTVNPDGRIFLIGTTYHAKDFYSRIQEEEPYKKNLFKFPAFTVGEDGKLVLGEDGKPISYWPERWPTDALLERQKEITYSQGSLAWNAQYMLDPSGYEGRLFKSDWLNFYTMKDDIEPRLGDLEYIMAVDPNIKEDPTSDNTAIVTAAVDRRRNEIYVLDIYAEPLDFIKQVQRLHEYSTRISLRVGKMHIPGEQHINKIGVESVAYQRALQQTGYLLGLPVVEVQHSRIDKNTRILRMAPHIENGRVKFPDPEAHPECRWYDKFYDEYVTFPRGRRDDMLDALEILIDIAGMSGNTSSIPFGPGSAGNMRKLFEPEGRSMPTHESGKSLILQAHRRR